VAEFRPASSTPGERDQPLDDLERELRDLNVYGPELDVPFLAYRGKTDMRLVAQGANVAAHRGDRSLKDLGSDHGLDDAESHLDSRGAFLQLPAAAAALLGGRLVVRCRARNAHKRQCKR
jgi:hypothetical protein